MMDDLIIDDKFFKDIGLVSQNPLVQGSVESFLRLKKKRSDI